MLLLHLRVRRSLSGGGQSEPELLHRAAGAAASCSLPRAQHDLWEKQSPPGSQPQKVELPTWLSFGYSWKSRREPALIMPQLCAMAQALSSTPSRAAHSHPVGQASFLARPGKLRDWPEGAAEWRQTQAETSCLRL